MNGGGGGGASRGGCWRRRRIGSQVVGGGTSTRHNSRGRHVMHLSMFRLNFILFDALFPVANIYAIEVAADVSQLSMSELN